MSNSGWAHYGDKWFYMGPDGCPMSGWLRLDGQSYYLNPEQGPNYGMMLSGWLIVDGEWYYLDPDREEGGYGRVKTGWLRLDGRTCYLDPKRGGRMARSETLTIDGAEYSFDGAGNLAGGGTSHRRKRLITEPEAGQTANYNN